MVSPIWWTWVWANSRSWWTRKPGMLLSIGSQRLGHDWATELNLPWFMNLTFQVPMQYSSLQHQTSLSLPYTATSWCFFHFGSASSFLLKLFLHSTPVAYWTPTDLGVHVSVSYFFALSYSSWGSQGKNAEVVCYSLFQWTMFIQNSPPWPVHLGWTYMAWLIFYWVRKVVVLVIRLVSFLWLCFSFSLPSDGWA